MTVVNTKKESRKKLERSITGIKGFDDISEGGLPKHRPTIVCGGAGSGKTIMALEFLVRGAALYNEPGVFLSFEENDQEIVTNGQSLNFDIESLIKKKKLYIEYMEISRGEVFETGDYNLEGLFVRLENAVKKIGAKRLVLDSLNALFYGIKKSILRHEITRLFNWIKSNKITAIITAETDSDLIIKYGLEQYVADCVILLDTRIINQITTRRLRIIKMRGSIHGINEYPFIIDDNGMSVLPLISEIKNHSLSTNRISSGIKDLDEMLDGKGYFQGSSILISGSAGTGKTSIAASLIKATCEKKTRALYCAFEESTSQVVRNMGSINLQLEPYLKSGLLRFYTSRPTLQNLELHLIAIKKLIREHKPQVVVLDPVTNLMSEGINSEIRLMLTSFVDFLKSQDITTLFTAAITLETIKSNPSDEGISSMVDTWIWVRDIEKNSERNRGIYVLKSRGMNHSTQVREFLISNEGIYILPIYMGPDGVLTGTAKLENTLKVQQQEQLSQSAGMNEKNEITRKRETMEENISQLKAKFKSEVDNLKQTKEENELKENWKRKYQSEIVAMRNKLDGSA